MLASAALLSAITAHAVPVAGQGTWETTLKARDINGDGVTDAYYSTEQNITWLADANYAATSGFAPGNPMDAYRLDPGLLDQPDAVAWAAGLNIHGVTGWRLPTAQNVAPSSCGPHDDGTGGGIGPGISCSFVPGAGVNELADLFSHTLGNSAGFGGWANTGLFLNVDPVASRPVMYLMGTIYTGSAMAPGHSGAEITFAGGYEMIALEGFPGWAWAVHDGDIAAPTPVPEPETYALMLAGLGVMAMVRARRGRKAA
jgi:hypothetical protein